MTLCLALIRSHTSRFNQFHDMASSHHHLPVSPRKVHYLDWQRSGHMYIWSVRVGRVQIYYKRMSLDNEGSLQIRRQPCSYIPETNLKNNWIQQTRSKTTDYNLQGFSLPHRRKFYQLHYNMENRMWLAMYEVHCWVHWPTHKCYSASRWESFLVISRWGFYFVATDPWPYTKDNAPQPGRVSLQWMLSVTQYWYYPDSKVHGANMVGHMNLAIWVVLTIQLVLTFEN